MINIDHRDNFVAATVFGEFDLADFKEFEQLLTYKIQFEGKLDLLFDLRQMAGFTLDVAWEEIKFSRRHGDDFRRIAVLSGEEWLNWSAWVAQFFFDAEVRIFEDLERARAWLQEDLPTPESN